MVDKLTPTNAGPSSTTLQLSGICENTSTVTPAAPPASKPTIIDQGSTHVLLHDNNTYAAVSPTAHRPLTVMFPNGATTTSTGTATLTANDVTVSAHLFPPTALREELLGIAPFTAQGCTAYFDDHAMTISRNGRIVLAGVKTPGTSQWTTDLHSLPQPQARLAVAYESVQHRAQWLSGLLGFPCDSTVQRALERDYIRPAEGWPTLYPSQWKRHAPQSPFTAIGHLVELRHGVNSTNAPLEHPAPLSISDDDGHIWSYSFALPIPPDVTVHADFKGPHPIPSARGHTHILVMVYKNYSHLEPAKGVNGASMADAYARGLAFYAARGVAGDQQHLRMDNVTSPELRALLAKRHVAGHPLQIEYVPPNVHRANRAEKAIQFFEASLLSVMAGAHPDYPQDQWDLSLPQLETQMAHLVPWGSDSAISAYHGLYGKRYDFKKHPFAPFGMAVSKQVDRNIRGSFGAKAKPGFFIGPSLDHYRTYRLLVRDKSKRWTVLNDCRMALHPHTPLRLPRLTPVDAATLALQDFTNALKAIAKSPGHDDARPRLPRSLVDEARNYLLILAGADEEPIQPPAAPPAPQPAQQLNDQPPVPLPAQPPAQPAAQPDAPPAQHPAPPQMPAAAPAAPAAPAAQPSNNGRQQPRPQPPPPSYNLRNNRFAALADHAESSISIPEPTPRATLPASPRRTRRQRRAATATARWKQVADFAAAFFASATAEPRVVSPASTTPPPAAPPRVLFNTTNNAPRARTVAQRKPANVPDPAVT